MKKNLPWSRDQELESNKLKHLNSSHKGLQPGWTRATFILKQEHINKIKALAYWERVTLKEILEEALVLYLHDKDVAEIPLKKSGYDSNDS